MKFFRSVAVLVSGTVLGHGITAAALPILSRLYTPDDFSVLAAYSGIVAILSVASCLRFDVAIALPNDEEGALQLLFLSVLTALIFSGTLFFLVVTFNENIDSLVSRKELIPYLPFIPLSMFLAGSYSAFQMWLVRQKKFDAVAKIRVLQSAVCVIAQVAIGLTVHGSLGLVFGFAVNVLIACLALGYLAIFPAENRLALRVASFGSLKRKFLEYRRFPKFSVIEALCNTASVQLPLLIIVGFSGPTEAGYLMMATYLMQAPTGLIGTAVGQVYLSQAANMYRSGKLRKFTKDVLFGLIKTGLVPFLAIAILSPFCFGFVLGPHWIRSGELVSWMTPWFFLQFLTAPISMGLHVTGNQKTALNLQVLGLLLRTGMVVAAVTLSPTKISEIYAVSGVMFYGIYLYITCEVVRNSEEKLEFAGFVPGEKDRNP